MKPFLLAAALFPLLAVAAASSAAAHPISVTETYAFVTRTRVAVRISVFLEDLYLFHNLTPNRKDFLAKKEILAGAEKHRQFLLERFIIRDVAGERLQGKFLKRSPLKVPDEGVPLAELMSHKIRYEFEYKIAKPPEFLTFRQNLADEEIAIPAEMQLIIKQENAGTSFAAMLTSGQPQTVRFDWKNPPLSADASQQEWDQWRKQQKDAQLGITSYSSLYSFLYIEDFEVRHEILIPLLTLEQSLTIARKDPAFLTIAEQDAAKEAIAKYFVEGNPLEIDGHPVKPRVQRIDFYGLDFKDFARRAKRRRVGAASARVGVILSYPASKPPRTVKLTWDRFNKHIFTVQLIAYAYEQVEKATLSRVGSGNSFQWTNPGRPALPEIKPVGVRLSAPPPWRLPLLSLAAVLGCACGAWSLARKKHLLRGIAVAAAGLIGAAAAYPFGQVEIRPPWQSAPQISTERAREVFQQLHRNVYRAFQFREEVAIYDALARCADGALLERLYLQIRSGLQMQEEGGAIARVKEVQLEQGSLKPPPQGSRNPQAFAFQCRWLVSGTVEHWGHVHTRTNRYQAAFTLEPRDGKWKFTHLDLQEEERVQSQRRVRGL